MPLVHRIQRLERPSVVALARDGRPRCQICQNGSELASLARFEIEPDWSRHRGSGACPACGREPAEVVTVVGIDPDRL